MSSLKDLLKNNVVRPMRPARHLVGWYRYRKADAYVVSHPKSGRTWVRTLLGKALAVHFGCDSSEIADPIDVIRAGCRESAYVLFVHSGLKVTSPSMDDYLKDRFELFSSKKVAHLVRDPRDVTISSFFHHTRRKGEEHTVDSFIHHPTLGIMRPINFLNEWWERRDLPRDFLLLRYEDLRENTVHELRRLAVFVGVAEISDQALETAVRYGDIETLRTASLSTSRGHRLAPRTLTIRRATRFGGESGRVRGLPQRCGHRVCGRRRSEVPAPRVWLPLVRKRTLT